MDDAEVTYRARKRKLALAACGVLAVLLIALGGRAAWLAHEDAQAAKAAEEAAQESSDEGEETALAESGEEEAKAVEPTEDDPSARAVETGEMKQFEEVLQKSLWVSDDGKYTLSFGNGTYEETSPAGNKSGSFAITAIVTSDQAGAYIVTASIKTDSKEAIMSYSHVENPDGTVSVAGFQCDAFSHPEGYAATERPQGEVRLDGFTEQGADLFGGDAVAVRECIEKWVTANCPTANVAVWGQVAEIDYSTQTASTHFELNDANKRKITVLFNANESALSVEEGWK